MGNNSLWPKRLYVLDVSRGFAALAVVLWHWQHFAFNKITLPKDFERDSQPLYAVLSIFYEKGFMGVGYFFLLSGFIFFWLYRFSIQNKDISFMTFWCQRFSRLYPLHFVTLLIVALLQIAYILHNGSSFIYPFNDIYHFFLNLVFASYWGFERGYSFNFPVWSVSIEIILYFVFFVIAYNRQGGILFCLGISVISFIIYINFCNRAIFNGLSFFFLGGFVFHSTFLISTKYKKLNAVIYSIAALSWLLTVANFYVFNLSDFIRNFGLIGKIFIIGFPNYILLPFTVCSLALIEINRGQFLKSISWIGDITYSSYLLHFPLQLLFALAVSYGALNSNFYLNPLYLLVFFSILIPLSYITFIGFERPIQKMIRNRHERCIKASHDAVPFTPSSPNPLVPILNNPDKIPAETVEKAI
jgi:peptidoglycan/LPS O-acetylase OafA/YrhL